MGGPAKEETISMNVKRLDPWVCSQLCENTVGSFHYKCVHGYLETADGWTCKRRDNIFTGQTGVISFTLLVYVGVDITNWSSVITEKLDWPNSLTTDYVTRGMWWADVHLDYIELVSYFSYRFIF
ncbi:low-density lipoprotein receptor-related protein 2-like [Lingula anatina]|uniref:Low-density lipoprotein receptor-related protein 2-like n=1 Tax=Lingula anatina TaxID=7574 RepID=A0A1S3INS7_LINAN|nr:low-density lipoprotein receptor-related protein 2-like [Lingula anatina]|eukprot:XP_013399189.1 low-density lipoprotein receptor-related protein 2-like [Lingula anatina]